MGRLRSVSSFMAATVCANPSVMPVDLWPTRRRVAHRVHRLNNSSSSRAEQNEKCVTHVAGQNCYPCPRLLSGAVVAHIDSSLLLRERAKHRGPCSLLGAG